MQQTPPSDGSGSSLLNQSSIYGTCILCLDTILCTNTTYFGGCFKIYVTAVNELAKVQRKDPLKGSQEKIQKPSLYATHLLNKAESKISELSGFPQLGKYSTAHMTLSWCHHSVPSNKFISY